MLFPKIKHGVLSRHHWSRLGSGHFGALDGSSRASTSKNAMIYSGFEASYCGCNPAKYIYPTKKGLIAVQGRLT